MLSQTNRDLPKNIDIYCPKCRLCNELCNYIDEEDENRVLNRRFFYYLVNGYPICTTCALIIVELYARQ